MDNSEIKSALEEILKAMDEKRMDDAYELVTILIEEMEE